MPFMSITQLGDGGSVTSTSFSISINGSLHGYFKGKRGLRQGNLMSPYLFTLVMDVLTLMLHRRVRASNSFTYHQYCSNLNIINLCFADDLFLFAHGDVDSARVIMESLDLFKDASGLIPSLPKSTTYFCNVLNYVKLGLSIMIVLALPLIMLPMFSVAAWNIRGLNLAPKQSEVRQVVNENQLSMCAILESHVDLSSLSNVCSRVFKTWDWTSNANLCNKGCRIILSWNMDVVNILVLSQSSQAMHVKILHKATNNVIFCSFIYAGNLPSERRHLWSDLGMYKYVVWGFPWVLMGDFNVALNLEDSFSGSLTLNSAMYDFKACVNKIEVMDINATGLHFTWNQKPKGGGGVIKKLDQIIGNIDFIDTFPGAYAIFQPYRISDHSPAVLKLPTLTSPKPKPFKFFNFLAFKTRFIEVMESHWNTQIDGHNMFKVVSKMKLLKKPLWKLLHDQGNLHERVHKLRLELDEVQKVLDINSADSILREEECVYIQAFNEAKLDEERFLKQKAKVDWLEAGDTNSTYFHKTIKCRNQRSRIDLILNTDNVEVSGSLVLDAFVSHFEQFL
ncbi:RNA-directed DNA polymerase, eukaryota, reverse transcriptase zinc-binding domain protein, partial [Tanacetum coccineum]